MTLPPAGAAAEGRGALRRGGVRDSAGRGGAEGAGAAVPVGGHRGREPPALRL